MSPPFVENAVYFIVSFEIGTSLLLLLSFVIYCYLLLSFLIVDLNSLVIIPLAKFTMCEQFLFFIPNTVFYFLHIRFSVFLTNLDIKAPHDNIL